MALAADFDLQLALGGAGKEGLAAGTAHDRFAVRRMNSILHVLSLLRRVMHYRRLLYHTAAKKQEKLFVFQKFFQIDYARAVYFDSDFQKQHCFFLYDMVN